MIEITADISIDEREIDESFVRSSGPGGQNVNKLSTAVQLRFDVRRSPSLPNDVAVRAMRLAGHRLTLDGVIVITAQRFRTQDAVAPPPKRRPTRPTAASRARRLEGKSHRSGVKALRGTPRD